MLIVPVGNNMLFHRSQNEVYLICFTSCFYHCEYTLLLFSTTLSCCSLYSIPYSSTVATLLVTVVYVLVNISYLSVLNLEEIDSLSGEAIAIVSTQCVVIGKWCSVVDHIMDFNGHMLIVLFRIHVVV